MNVPTLITPPTQASRSREQVIATLAERGLPAHAAQWLIRALHPPALVEGTPPIPDCCSRVSARMSTKAEATYTGSNANVAAGADWDLMIITTPGDVIGAFAVAGPAGLDFSGALHTAQNYNILQRPVGIIGSSSIMSTGGAFPVSVTLPSGDYIAFRTTCSSITTYMTASDMFNGGTVTAGTWSPGLPSVSGRLGTASIPSTPTWAYGAGRYDVPMTESAILEMCDSPYVAPARDGHYIPLILNGLSIPFVQRMGTPSVPFTPVGYGPPLPIAITTQSQLVTIGTGAESSPGFGMVPQAGQDGQCSLVPEYYSASSRQLTPFGSGSAQQYLFGPSTIGGGNTGFTDTACSVVIYRSLAYSASITVKLLMGMEVVPGALSALRDLQQPGVPACPAAMQAYREITALLPKVLPSKDNSLGLLLNAVRDLIPVVLPRVKRAITAFMSDGPAPVAHAAPRPPAKGKAQGKGAAKGKRKKSKKAGK